MKKLISLITALVFVCGFNLLASAKSNTNITLMFNYSPCVITNSKGQTLNYNGFKDYSGDLKVVKENYIDPDICELTVEESDWFSYSPNKNNNCEFGVISGKITAFVDGENIDSIRISSENEQEDIKISGKNANCNISGYFSTSKLDVAFSGKT